jgi:SAM-dependent methyltransferase
MEAVSEDNRRFYEAFAPYYEEVYADVDAEEAVRQWLELLEREELIPPREERLRRRMRLLDVGCGPGWHAVHWARAGFDVVCLDSSPTMLEIARKRFEREGVRAALLRSAVEELAGADLEVARMDVAAAHFNFLNLFAGTQLVPVLKAIGLAVAGGAVIMTDAFVGSRGNDAFGEDAGSWRREVLERGSRSNLVRWTRSTLVLDERFWIHSSDELGAAFEAAGWSSFTLRPWSPGGEEPTMPGEGRPAKVTITARRAARR